MATIYNQKKIDKYVLKLLFAGWGIAILFDILVIVCLESLSNKLFKFLSSSSSSFSLFILYNFVIIMYL